MPANYADTAALRMVEPTQAEIIAELICPRTFDEYMEELEEAEALELS